MAERSYQWTPSVPKQFTPQLSEDDAYAQARLLKALADPTRLRILSLLAKHEGDVCVSEIVETFALEQPTISFHLRKMLDAHLLQCRKQGLHAYYYIHQSKLQEVQALISQLIPIHDVERKSSHQ